MRIIQLIKPVLFLYECLRTMILAVVLLLKSNGYDFFGQLTYTAPSALFPLMALFIWLNQERYSAYLPLFLAGKCIVFITSLVFSIISGQVTMIGGLMGFDLVFIFDILAIIAALLIYRDNKKITEIKSDINTTEEKLCE